MPRKMKYGKLKRQKGGVPPKYIPTLRRIQIEKAKIREERVLVKCDGEINKESGIRICSITKSASGLCEVVYSGQGE